MPGRAKRMLKLRVGETSGVDAPAHQLPGWMIQKAEGAEGAESVFEDELDDEIEEVLRSLGGAVEVDVADLLRENLDALPEPTRKAAEAFLATIDNEGGTMPTEAELQKALDDEKAARSEAERQLAVLKAGGTLVEAGAGDDSEEAEFRKALATLPAPIAKAWEEDRARSREAEKIAKAERDKRVDAEYVAKADGFSYLPVNSATLGPVLREIDEKLSKEAAAEITRLLKAANAGGSEFFSELGGAGGQAGGSAWDEIVTKANKLRADSLASGNELTFEKAVEKVTDIDNELATRYRAELTGQGR